MMKKPYLFFLLSILIPVKGMASSGYIEVCDHTTHQIKVDGYNNKEEKITEILNPNNCKAYSWKQGSHKKLRFLNILETDIKKKFKSSLHIEVKSTDNGGPFAGKITRSLPFNTLSIMKYKVSKSGSAIGGSKRVHVNIVSTDFNPYGIHSACYFVSLDSKHNTFTANCSKGHHFHKVKFSGLDILQEGMRSTIPPSLVKIVKKNYQVALPGYQPHQLPPGNYIERCNAVYETSDKNTLYAGCFVSSTNYSVSKFDLKKPCANIRIKDSKLSCQTMSNGKVTSNS